MTSLGETLRRARMERKLELNRIADQLKISASMLQAIEEERFDKLPGGVFARSFVRQYARLLEVDESEIESALTRVLEPPPEPPHHAHGLHVPEHEIPLPRVLGWQAIGDASSRWWSSAWALALVIVVMLACAGAYAWWQRHPVLAHRNAPVPAVVPRPAAEPTLPVVAPPPAIPSAETPAAAPTPVAVPEPTSEPTPAVTADAAVPNPDAPVQVEVTAQESTWISVRSDGKYLFSGVLEPNQSRTVSANQTVWLRVGNAAGVEIRLNGQPIGPLGGTGLVRTLQFTPGGFHIVPPEVPKPAPPTDPPNPL